ncbi:hypothetical protein CS542_02795 [Pedobacter sp. IW39]|nr:hypothetical protein CS542_02795 [Pedobacter sp. IW39]
MHQWYSQSGFKAFVKLFLQRIFPKDSKPMISLVSFTFPGQWMLRIHFSRKAWPVDQWLYVIQ